MSLPNKSNLSSIPPQDLPRTFGDAISVVKKLGLNSLWTDSLCIIQDTYSH